MEIELKRNFILLLLRPIVKNNKISLRHGKILRVNSSTSFDTGLGSRSGMEVPLAIIVLQTPASCNFGQFKRSK